jgi:hypothetical protein
MLRSHSIALLLGFLAPAAAQAQSHHPGPVVLLGESVEAGLVPELARPHASSVLLVAEAAPTPAPIDARPWGGDHGTEIVQLPPADDDDPDRAVLARIRGARLIALGPGTTRAWLDALLARERASVALGAVHEAWSRGATLVGRGDSAALLCAAFVVSGPDELGWKAHNPRDPEVARAGQGLGYQPWALVDTGGRAGGRIDRLLRAVVEEKLETAGYLPESSALVADLERAQLRVHGKGTVIWLDARRARRLRGGIVDARLSLLPPGSVWSAADRRVELEPRKTPAEQGERSLEVGDVHDPAAIARAVMESPQAPPPKRWRLRDGREVLVLRWDQESQWGPTPDGSATWVEGLSVDLWIRSR